MTVRRAVYIGVSLALSVILIFLLLSRIGTAELGRALTRIFVPGLLAYMAIALLGAGLRAWRYRIFLSPRPGSFPGKSLSRGKIFSGPPGKKSGKSGEAKSP